MKELSPPRGFEFRFLNKNQSTGNFFLALMKNRQLRKVGLKQVHGKQVHSVTETVREEALIGDGLITQQKGIALIIKTADCVPLLLMSAEENSRVVGALHCGWRGLRSGIIKEAFDLIKKIYGAEARGFSAFIGPAICGRCYSVGEALVEQFAERGFSSSFMKHFAYQKKAKEFYFDLKRGAKHLLEEAGVREEKINLSSECTRCSQTFYSHRENQTKRRNLSYLAIK